MMLYELDEIEKTVLLPKGETTMSVYTPTEFDKVFAEMDDPNYPASCNDCGAEGTNASLENHEHKDHGNSEWR